ncbi:MAG: glycoside hydrolase family 43 protein [Lacibacter sp.]
MNKHIFIATLLVSGIIWSGCKKKNKIRDDSDTPVVSDSTFINPLLNSGPDPWVIQKDSFYYYMHTLGNRIDIWKTKSMSLLKNAPVSTVWLLPASGANSRNIWAPELHYINSKWYLYYTAGSSGDLNTQRTFVLENNSADPLSNNWVDKGKIGDPSADYFSIDGTVLQYNGSNYFIWSSHPSSSENKQYLYIARMSNPWTIETPRQLLSSPDYDWEKIGGSQWVNEGPEILRNAAGDVFLVYSASGCWTDDYTLGMMSLNKDTDPLIRSNWTKKSTPVFTKNAAARAYGPGHNGFFKSPDGKEDWIIYHANSNSGEGCGDLRNPRIQKFSWNADGTPDFGQPVYIHTAIKKPSGEK